MNHKHPHASGTTRELRLNAAPQRFEIRKNADGSRSISGYAAVFNSLSEDLGGFKEQLKQGCFSQSLRDNPDVLCLYGHDTNQILGRVSSGTLTVAEDDKGLKFTCLLPATSTARDLIALMERGDISQMSFGFSCVQDDWSEVNGQTIRTVIEAMLFEVSVVSMPAYSQTVVNLRGASRAIRERIRQRRSDAPTKKVAGVELPASSFAYVGDPDKPDTWKLPVYFPGDEKKTVDHIKDALARFDQTEGIPDSDKAHVYAKIVGSAKSHGIKVTAEKLSDRDWDDDGYDDDTDDDDYTDADDTVDADAETETLRLRLRWHELNSKR
jgi:uncharacterized protein